MPVEPGETYLGLRDDELLLVPAACGIGISMCAVRVPLALVVMPGPLPPPAFVIGAIAAGFEPPPPQPAATIIPVSAAKLRIRGIIESFLNLFKV
jgi:hypothetical protein